VDRALARLATVIPAMGSATPARYWGGMIDLTPDGLPIVDGRGGPEGLTLVTGLSGHGFTLGPVLGVIAADLALSGTTNWEIAPLSLARFAGGRVRAPELMV
jgi:sarcosine oxidase subunit beta